MHVLLHKMLTSRPKICRFLRPNYKFFWRFSSKVGTAGPTDERHLICFKFWTAERIKEIIDSAIGLKRMLAKNSHFKKLDLLSGSVVTILSEVNEPACNLAVSKAACLLGAQDNTVVDKLMWEQDYNGRIFSAMCDVIFVTTGTHMCLLRFAEKSCVPVLCIKSRTHAIMQSLATIMAMEEHYNRLIGLNIAYIGPAAPILNSYLLLCPLLGANIRFKCSCNVEPVSPLLYEQSEKMSLASQTCMKKCETIDEVLKDANVVIAGPTTKRKEKVEVFRFTKQDIYKGTPDWIFFHCCPRGEEVSDDLFCNYNSRTFDAFENMHYIAAALMAKAVKGHLF